MYGLSGARKDAEDVIQRRKEQTEQKKQAYTERRATAMFPGVPLDEALQRYEQYKQGRQASEEMQREGWPVLAAIGAGLLIMTFLGKRR